MHSTAALVPAHDGSLSGLRQRRRALAELAATLTWDLGGLAFEMAVRDHYRLDGHCGAPLLSEGRPASLGADA